MALLHEAYYITHTALPNYDELSGSSSTLNHMVHFCWPCQLETHLFPGWIRVVLPPHTQLTSKTLDLNEIKQDLGGGVSAAKYFKRGTTKLKCLQELFHRYSCLCVCFFELQGQRYENLVPLLLGCGTRGPAEVQTTMAEVKGRRLGLSDRLIWAKHRALADSHWAC